MISVEEAENIILANTVDFGREEINFSVANGRVLKEDLFADRDFPPFDRVAMDGIAIQYKSYAQGNKKFKIESIAPAGDPIKNLKNSDNCIEVMTGAVMPTNTDTVIRYEDVKIIDEFAIITETKINKGQNIHRKGTDSKAQQNLLSNNKIIGPAEMGLISTIGKTNIKVSKQAKIVIISTGNELVNVDQKPMEWQIRRSNVHTIRAYLFSLNINAAEIHLPDDKNSILETTSSLLEKYDVLIFSGGVSKGKYDFIPDVLNALNVKKLFHRVAQKPGKPFWFGVKQAKRIFAFPGNPVSSFLCLIRYFKPWMDKSFGLKSTIGFAKLDEGIEFKSKLNYFVTVLITNDSDGFLKAKPIKGNGSGDLTILSSANAFMELPADKNEFIAGESYPFYLWKPLF